MPSSGLEQRQTRQLAITPQLRQAIRLLQFSNLELAAYVEEQLERNPFLEREDAQTPAADGTSPASGVPASGVDAGLSGTGRDTDAIPSATGDHTAAASIDSDMAAAGFTFNDRLSAGSGSHHDGPDPSVYANCPGKVSLREHLAGQLHIATRNPADLFIGAYLIDMIDDAGYLQETPESIAGRLGTDIADVERVHELVTGFDPCGAGARNLKECLKLQLVDSGRYNPVMETFLENIDCLARHDIDGLMKATGASREDVLDMISLVRSLNPKPGYAFDHETVRTVEPDVFIAKAADGGWQIELNTRTLPKVLVNRQYHAKVSASAPDKKDAEYICEQIANANWLARTLDQRARTILKVSREIVRQQDAFLERGVGYLRPLNLKTVAEYIDMHESTVSRVTSGKYMATPRGMFELKYFFTSAVRSSEGDAVHASESVRHRIRELVGAETQSCILSDSKIAAILKAEGIHIARRTVGKYREILGIPSSSCRRRILLQTAV